MTTRVIPSSTIAAAAVLAGAAGTFTDWTPQDGPAGLEAFYEDGYVLQDRNGDGHLDYLHGHLQLRANPTLRDRAAAADIAARLGYETMSLDLPVTQERGGRAVLVGTNDRTDALPLEPGEGAVALSGSDDVWVTGGDSRGVQAAAAWLAGRAPFVWTPDSTTLQDVVDSVRSVTRYPARVVGVFVEAGVPGVGRVDVRLPEPEAGEDVLLAAVDNARDALRFPGVRLLRVHVGNLMTQVANPDAEPDDGSGRRPGGGNKSDLDLSSLLSNDGFFSDTDRNLIPDRVDVVLSQAEPAGGAVIDLAARIGLEATGVSVPIAVVAEDVGDPEQGAPLVLVGRSHPLIDSLIANDKMSEPTLAPGEGWLEVIPEAFDERTALVAIGADEPGLERAVRQLAERMPHLFERGKDRPTLDDVEHDLWMSLSSRSPVGQAAAALYKLDQIIPTLPSDVATIHTELHLEKADPGMRQVVLNRLAGLGAPVTVNVGTIDVQNGDTIIAETIDIPSEVETLREIVRSRVLPAAGGRAVQLQARVSESPAIRAGLEEELTQALLEAGASLQGTSVEVLSAYKQGFSWMYDRVREAIADLNVDSVIIRFAELGPPAEWPQQAMYTKTRWLLELFPIDEVLSRDLDLPLDRFRFEMAPVGATTYEVEAIRGGAVVYQDTFEPKWVLRPFLDRFPDYEHARVTTGWVTATADGQTVVDERISTDLETFWDHFQASTLDSLYRQVMSISDGAPRASDAPHFGELRVDISLSEPEYQLGVDQEQISPMEALHEEIYFATLHFFDVMGRMARGQGLSYPGRVIPVVRPKDDGLPGTATITATGFGADAPVLKVRYRTGDGRWVTERRDLLNQTLNKPSLLRGKVRVDEPGFTELGARIQVDFGADQRAAFVRRTSARRVDASITFAEQTSGVLQRIGELREAGLYTTALAYRGMGALTLTSWWGHEFDADSIITTTMAAGGTPPIIPDPAGLRPGNYEWNGEPLVQWDTPIPPPEAAAILSRMSTFDEATMYRAGTSYLGKDVWAMDVMAPLDGAYWSQAKASALKPTVIYSARQHANEVSSTSHTLRLAEMILTDDAFANVLDRVNVVFHPITNADGAQLAYDLYQITPTHMLHAGYLGSLGVDVTAGQNSDDPIYPETRVRPKLWRTWLPDIFLNPHGYPSHEWVQPFSEYAGWVRTRTTESRGWWGMRGWFMPGFGYTDSADFPDHKAAAWEIRDRITSNINALPEIRALNRRAYARHQRYGWQFDEEVFKRDYSDSVLIYTSIKGSTGSGGGTMNNPNVTIWSGSTEAPDETASGDWMKLVASAGLAWDRALLDYLVEGNHVIERTRTPFADGMALKLHRPRPAKRPEEN